MVDRYINGKFVGQHKATIGADFMPMDVQVDDMSVAVQIWDTAVRTTAVSFRYHCI